MAWVSTSYILANVIVLPMTAFFTERFGRKRYLTFSIVLFIAASVLCGTATSLGQLVLWRLLQGAGGAALLSTAQATLRQIFTREEQGLVQAIFLLGIIVAPTLGPTLGGYITDNASWHWCFFINLPIGILSTFLVVTFLHDPPQHGPRTAGIDWLGIGLLVVGVGSLQYVLEEGNIKDWFASQLIVYLSIVGGASPAVGAALVAADAAQRAPGHPAPRAPQPRPGRLDLPLRRARLRPLWRRHHLPALHAEHPRLLADADRPGDDAGGPDDRADGAGVRPAPDRDAAAGRRADPDPRRHALMMWSMWDLGHLSTSAGEADARSALIIRGAALGLLFTPINNVAFGSLKPHEAQQASGLINLARQLGGSFGIAVLGAYLTRHIAYHRADLATNMYPGNPAFAERFERLVAGLSQSGLVAGRRPAAGAGGARRDDDAPGGDARVQ